MAFYTLIVVATAFALVALATALNVAVHLPRTRDSIRDGRRIAAPLSTAGLIEEAVATVLVIVGSACTTTLRGVALTPLRTGRSRRRDGSPQVVVIPEERVPRHASWLLQRRLWRRGWNVIVHNRSKPPTDDRGVERVAQAILQHCRTEGSVTLLGIGSGGLIARQLAATEPRFRRILTLATPHGGTVGALAPARLQPDGPYVTNVATTDPTPRSFDAVAIYSEADAWLDPVEAAYYPGAFNVVVRDVGHLASLCSNPVFRLIAENLETVLPPSAPIEQDG